MKGKDYIVLEELGCLMILKSIQQHRSHRAFHWI